MDNIETYITYALALVGAFSVIASVTPTTKDDEALALIRKIINLLALNVGKAKPKD